MDPRPVRWLPALVVVAACSSPSAPSPAPAARDAGAAARWIECTEAQRAPMERLLLSRAHLVKADPQLDGLTCVTMQLRSGPAFFVELVGSEADQRHRLHGVIATDGTTELVPLREATLDWAQLRGGRVWFETLDLDGDGNDELVVHRGDERQPVAEWLDLVAIRGKSIVELAGPRVSWDDPDVDEHCHGVVSREKAGHATELVITTSGSSGASEHCLANGRHVFALVGDRLVERAATASP